MPEVTWTARSWQGEGRMYSNCSTLVHLVTQLQFAFTKSVAQVRVTSYSFNILCYNLRCSCRDFISNGLRRDLTGTIEIFNMVCDTQVSYDSILTIQQAPRPDPIKVRGRTMSCAYQKDDPTKRIWVTSRPFKQGDKAVAVRPHFSSGGVRVFLRHVNMDTIEPEICEHTAAGVVTTTNFTDAASKVWLAQGSRVDDTSTAPLQSTPRLRYGNPRQGQ
jgi:hypothetical protein